MRQNEPFNTVEVSLDPDVTITGLLLKEASHDLSLTQAHLQGEQSPDAEVPSRPPDDLPDHVEPVRPGEERLAGLPVTNLGVQLHCVHVRDVRRVGNDDVKQGIAAHRLEQRTTAQSYGLFQTGRITVFPRQLQRDL